MGGVPPGRSRGLLERDHELALFRESVAAADEGNGRLLVVEGRPGIGKSRLLAAGREIAESAGHQVVVARGSELERDFAFGVALQLFESVVNEPSSADPLSGSAALAESLLRPPQATNGSRTGQAPPAGDFSLLHGLHWLAANLAEERPLMILVDDLHWSDRPSVRFLLYLAQRLEDLPIVVAVATRESEAAEEPELAAHALAQLVRLEPLSRGAVGEIVRSVLPDADDAVVAACFASTQGNPFYLDALMIELAGDGIAAVGPDAERIGRIAPDAVLRMVLIRLARMSPDHTALARSVAVLGDDAQLARATTLANLTGNDGERAADELALADILSAREPLCFVHPLVRQAIYLDISERQRSSTHRRAARLLGNQQASSERVASHLLASEPADDPWAVQALRSAAERATGRGAPHSAATYLQRALDEPPPDEARAEVMLALGCAEAAAGLPTAVARLEEVSALADGPRARADALLLLGRALYSAGQHDAAIDAFERGIAGLNGDAPDLALRLEAERTLIDLLPGMSGDDSTHGRIGRILAQPADRLTASERLVLVAAAVAHTFAGTAPRETVLEFAGRALDGDKLLEQETADGSGLYGATLVLHNCGELAWDDRVLSAAVDDARRRGSVLAFATASYCRSWPRIDAGRIAEGIADAERAIDARRYGWEQFLPSACAVAAMGRLELGDLDGARAALAEVPQAEWSGSPVWFPVLKVRGFIAMAEGRPADALEDFLGWGAIVPDWTPASQAGWRSSAGMAMAQLGRADEGAALAREELERARRFGAALAIGVALRALGVIEGGEAGIEWLREAVTVLEASEGRLEHCRALVDLGAALRRANRRTEAREPLEQGLDLADRCGALALVQRAHEELVVAGGRPRRERIRGIDSLTPGERRVAGMVAEGMSNREIAEALFVTVKAVQWHLRHIYEKLDATSREELVDELREAAAAPA